MELMARYSDNYFDLAIVDPPYGIEDKISTGGGSHTKSKSKFHQLYKENNKKWDVRPSSDYWEELFRVSKNQIVFGANYFGLVGGMIYWHKNVTMPTYSTGELAWVSWLNKLDFVNIAWHGMIQHDMSNKETRIHPTQKPVALYKWILDKYAKQGDKILDTHLGSMSIAIACADYGFDLYGCELDSEYYKKGLERIQNHINQLDIFTERPKIITDI